MFFFSILLFFFYSFNKNLLFKFNLLLDSPKFGQIFFQDPSTNIFEKMILLHHEILFYMIVLFVLVLWFIVRINILCKIIPTRASSFLNESVYLKTVTPFAYSVSFNYLKKRGFYKHENTLLEILWTLFPTLLLLIIAIPSLCLLYLLQSDKGDNFTIKVIGNQWFWTYSNFINFDYLNNQSIQNSNYIDYKSRYNNSCLDTFNLFEKKNLNFSCNFYLFMVLDFININNSFKFQPLHLNSSYLDLRILNQDSFFFWDLSLFYFIHDSAYLLFFEDLSYHDLWLPKKNNVNIYGKTETNFQFIKFQRIFESNLIPTQDLKVGDLRLLEVDQRLILPRNIKIRFLVTSTDVLHSWSIPSLGIKVDACPGRINEIHTNIYRKSVFYGQCSEICGILHGFMPIVIQTVSLLDYFKYTYITSPFKL